MTKYIMGVDWARQEKEECTNCGFKIGENDSKYYDENANLYCEECVGVNYLLVKGGIINE